MSLTSVGTTTIGARPAAPAGRAHHTPQRGAVQVVHVRMGQQDDVDRWKIAHPHTGPPLPPQQDQPGGEDRIEEQVLPRGLHQE